MFIKSFYITAEVDTRQIMFGIAKDKEYFFICIAFFTITVERV
jgi:hypothetical protein